MDFRQGGLWQEEDVYQHIDLRAVVLKTCFVRQCQNMSSILLLGFCRVLPEKLPKGLVRISAYTNQSRVSHSVRMRENSA